jgi:diaminohydroxyphosphoribosylaminopyrimidine deaminase / 5-amino-6-(5-phosphoribosylamino)uracil reductase
MNDHASHWFMLRALALARRGAGFTRPNPMVGALVVRDGRIVGCGYHERFGNAHAEVNALGEAGAQSQGATLYVTLEPCNHFGKTPPCTEAIIRAGIRRVVIAVRDPNPAVKGGGIERLREAELDVEVGLLEDIACELTRGWRKWLSTREPAVILKLATSLDGKITAPNSRWLSGPISRAHVQRLRSSVDAVMVGAGTVEADNPQLTNRSGRGGQPLRVVLDSKLRTKRSSALYQPPLAQGTLVFCGKDASGREELEAQGVQVIQTPRPKVELHSVLSSLGEMGIQTVLCEGGAELAASLLREGRVDLLLLYTAPFVSGPLGLSWGEEAAQLKLKWTKRIGRDVLSAFTAQDRTMDESRLMQRGK